MARAEKEVREDVDIHARYPSMMTIKDKIYFITLALDFEVSNRLNRIINDQY